MSNFVPLILQKNENIIKAKKKLHISNKYASHTRSKQNKNVQVISIEIDALLRKLSQSMKNDCLPDCATFLTNLHKLFCDS